MIIWSTASRTPSCSYCSTCTAPKYSHTAHHKEKGMHRIQSRSGEPQWRASQWRPAYLCVDVWQSVHVDCGLSQDRRQHLMVLVSHNYTLEYLPKTSWLVTAQPRSPNVAFWRPQPSERCLAQVQNFDDSMTHARRDARRRILAGLWCQRVPHQRLPDDSRWCLEVSTKVRHTCDAGVSSEALGIVATAADTVGRHAGSRQAEAGMRPWM